MNERIRATLKRVTRTSKRSSESREAFEAAVVEALRTCTYEQVAEAAGFKSTSPVYSIKRKSERKGANDN